MTINYGARGLDKIRVPLLVPHGSSSGPEKAIAEIIAFARLVADKIDALESVTLSGALSPITARAGEDGITMGRLIHIRDDGVAFLARNTLANRACTHICAGVSSKGQVAAFGFGHHPIACLPFQNNTVFMPLWLSHIPGHAMDSEPDSAEVVQIVGHRYTQRDTTGGLCGCVFKPEFTGTIHSSRLPSSALAKMHSASFVGIPSGSSEIGRVVIPRLGRPARFIKRVSVFSGDAIYATGSSVITVGDISVTLPASTQFATQTGDYEVDTSGGDVQVSIESGTSWGGHANLSIEIEVH